MFEKIANKASAIRKDLDELENLIALSWSQSNPNTFDLEDSTVVQLPVPTQKFNSFDEASTALGMQGLCEMIMNEPSSNPTTVKFCRGVSQWLEEKGRLSHAQAVGLERIWNWTYKKKRA